jgi:hypothetical protein
MRGPKRTCWKASKIDARAPARIPMPESEIVHATIVSSESIVAETTTFTKLQQILNLPN